MANMHKRAKLEVLAAAAAALGLAAATSPATAEWKPTKPVEFNGAAEKRQRIEIPLSTAREHALAVGLQRFQRLGCRLFDVLVVALY